MIRISNIRHLESIWMHKLIGIWSIGHLRIRWIHWLSQSWDVEHLIAWWRSWTSIVGNAGGFHLLADIKHSDRRIIHESRISVSSEGAVLLVKISWWCAKVVVIHGFLRVRLLIWSLFHFGVRTVSFWLLAWSRWVSKIIYWSFRVRWLVVVHWNIIFLISSVSWAGRMVLATSLRIIAHWVLSVWFRSTSISRNLISLTIFAFVLVFLFPWERLLTLLVTLWIPVSLGRLLIIALMFWWWRSHPFIPLFAPWRIMMSR